MSRAENQVRHRDNLAIHKGRHGSEKYNELCLPRGGGAKYGFKENDVVFYEVHLLTPEEVFYNEGLLENKPQCSEDYISSVIPVDRTGVALIENRNGNAIQIRKAIVAPDQVALIEELWLSSIQNGTIHDDVLYTDDTTQ
jgi:hypothetical protein